MDPFKVVQVVTVKADSLEVVWEELALLLLLLVVFKKVQQLLKWSVWL